jgi:hypothetical protein
LPLGSRALLWADGLANGAWTKAGKAPAAISVSDTRRGINWLLHRLQKLILQPAPAPNWGPRPHGSGRPPNNYSTFSHRTPGPIQIRLGLSVQSQPPRVFPMRKLRPPPTARPEPEALSPVTKAPVIPGLLSIRLKFIKPFICSEIQKNRVPMGMRHQNILDS